MRVSEPRLGHQGWVARDGRLDETKVFCVPSKDRFLERVKQHWNSLHIVERDVKEENILSVIRTENTDNKTPDLCCGRHKLCYETCIIGVIYHR